MHGVSVWAGVGACVLGAVAALLIVMFFAFLFRPDNHEDSKR
jgi:hypothetical protein